MTNYLRQFSFLCGIALVMLGAFPVFAQESVRPSQVEKKPLQDFGEMVVSRVQNKELDLSQNFLIEVSGEITKEGKFDSQKTKYVRTEGNEKMLAVAKDAIGAFNESGVFIYLSDLDISKLNLIIEQNDSEMSAVINLEFMSANKARSMASMFNVLISAARMTDKENADIKTFLNGTKISANDKFVTIKTAVEKSVGQEIIQRNLNKEIERKAKAGR